MLPLIAPCSTIVTNASARILDTGQYWGEMGYMRLEMGKNILGIEGEVAWATPGTFTVSNFPCYENGKNCVGHEHYTDPSTNMALVKRRLASDGKDSRKNIRG